MELLLKESIVKNDALMRYINNCIRFDIRFVFIRILSIIRKIKNAEEINDELRNALSETCQKNRFDAGVVECIKLTLFVSFIIS